MVSRVRTASDSCAPQVHFAGRAARAARLWPGQGDRFEQTDSKRISSGDAAILGVASFRICAFCADNWHINATFLHIET